LEDLAKSRIEGEGRTSYSGVSASLCVLVRCGLFCFSMAVLMRETPIFMGEKQEADLIVK
jgi:hypothetical protein